MLLALWECTLASPMLLPHQFNLENVFTRNLSLSHLVFTKIKKPFARSNGSPCLQMDRGTEMRLLEFDVCGAFALSAGVLSGQMVPVGMDVSTLAV